MDRSKVALGVGAVLALVLAFFLIPGKSRPIDRTDGPIPFVWSGRFNHTVREYLNTQPSRYVLLLTGPYQSGKSRLMDVLAADMVGDGRLVIKFDAGIARSIEDLKKLVTLSIIDGFTSISESLSGYRLKSVAEEGEGAAEINTTITNREAARIFKTLTYSINNIDKGGISDRHISRIFRILEQMYDVAHPVIFIDNVDAIAALGTAEDPEFGKKLLQVLMAKLSRRDLYEQRIPIVCEAKDSSFAVLAAQENVFRVMEVAELEDPQKTLVTENQAFKASELKLITQAFGAHAGSIARVYESLRYGMTVEKAIKKEEEKITHRVKGLTRENETICNQKLTTRHTSEMVADMLKEGILYVTNGNEIVPANKAVARALC